MTNLTCEKCQAFENYYEKSGRGWCKIFDRDSKKHHLMTRDCINNGAAETQSDPEEELNQPYTEFTIGSKVKIINGTQSHQDWLVGEVINNYYNSQCFRSIETYLSESTWKIQVYLPNKKNSIWLNENQVCLLEQSHLIDTKEIF